jgi:ATP-binding cassette subfamily F protein 3
VATLQVQRVHLAFGDRDILKDVSFTLNEQSRSALAGGNGSGKSTLLKVISAQMSADDLQVSTSKNLRISYLPQSDIVFNAGTVYQEVEKAFSRFQELSREQHAIETQLADSNPTVSTEPLLHRLAEIQEYLLAHVSRPLNRFSSVSDLPWQT